MAPHATDVVSIPELVVENGTSANTLGLDPIVNDSQPQPALRTIQPFLAIEEHPIDEIRPLEVIVIGAGIAGISAGILLPRKVPGIKLTILERHSDVVSFQRTLFYIG